MRVAPNPVGRPAVQRLPQIQAIAGTLSGSRGAVGRPGSRVLALKREILISGSPRETRVAILEDDRLVELLVDRPDARRTVGDIYLGRVEAVLPGIQAAFVDIGAEKSAFLHASDLIASDEDEEPDERENGRSGDDDEADDEPQNGGGGRRGSRRKLPSVTDALE